MSMKIIAAALLASALVSAPAFAQSSPPAGSGASSSATQAVTTQKPGTWRAAKLIGVNVYNNNNEKIGDIKELITDQSGKIDIAVIGVGGFLGMGEHNVGLPWSQIKFVEQPRQATTGSSDRPAAGTASSASASAPRDYPDHAVLNMTKDQLKAMPAFRFASDTRSSSSSSTGGQPAGTRPTPPAQQQPQPQPQQQR